MKRVLLLLFALITASSAKDHPRIIAGMALSAEQSKAYGVMNSAWPSLAQGDRLLLEQGDRRLLLEVKNFAQNAATEAATLNWIILAPGSAITGTKTFEHEIATRKAGEGLRIAPAPPRETIDAWNFSWHVDGNAKRVILDIPAGVAYTLIRVE
jgi:hypothetical protein